MTHSERIPLSTRFAFTAWLLIGLVAAATVSVAAWNQVRAERAAEVQALPASR